MPERLGERVSPEGSLRGAVTILPTGACEAHGPHLPLDSDVRIAVGMAERAARRLREAGRPAWVLPPLTYGVTLFARNFPGTLTISPDTLTSLAAEVLEGAHASGASALAIANAHLEPANVDALFAACARVHAKTGVRVGFPHPGSRRNAARLAAAAAPLDGHSGIYETSLLLALAPGLVRDPSELPENPSSLADAIVAGASCFEEAGGPHAYFGAPARASASLGELLLDELAAMLVESIEAAGFSSAPRSPDGSQPP